MHELTKTLEHAVAQTKFTSSRSGTVTPGNLKQAYNSRKGGDGTWLFLDSVKIAISDERISDLAEQLEILLENYLQPDTKRIGNGLFLLMGGDGTLAHPTITEFAKVLIAGAAKLGAPRVIELLLGWIDGKPLRYRFCTLLEGVRVDAPSMLAEGICLSKLPASSADLPASLPSDPWTTITDYLGGKVLSVDCEMSPALYTPEKVEDSTVYSIPQKEDTIASNALPNFSFDNFCESMSLACNNCVEWQLRWVDYGELRAFSSMSGGTRYKQKTMPQAATFTQEHMNQAREIYLMRHSSGASNSPRSELSLAISRWIKSKRPNSNADKLIELRIALESLYVRGGMAEKGFRLATYASWHLGRTFEERLDCYQTLRKIYDDASRTIHAEKLKHTIANPELLSTAQDICRQGILKRLFESAEPSWNELVLGKHADTSVLPD